MTYDLHAEIANVWGRTWQPQWGHITLRLNNNGTRNIKPGTLSVKHRKQDGFVSGHSQYSNVELGPGEHTLISLSTYPAGDWLSLKYQEEGGGVYDLFWRASIKVTFWRNAVIVSEVCSAP